VLDNNKDSYVRYLNTTRDRTGNTDKIKEITHGNQEAQLRILEALNLFREAMPSNREKPIKIS
jgi:hypothetical protein